MKTKTNFTILLLGFAVLLILGSCGNKNASTVTENNGNTLTIPNGKYKLAVYLPMTGNFMQYGIMLSNGIKLAVDHWNQENGGINGHPVEIEIFDDKNDQTECVNIAELITGNKDKYIAAIGTFSSGVAMAATPIYEREKLLMFNPCGSHPDFYKQGDYIFAIAMTSKFESLLYAKAYFELFNAKEFAMIAPQNDSFFITKSTYETYAKNNDANFYYELYVQGNTQDYTPIISKLFNGRNIDVLSISGDYITSASIVLQLDQLGLKKEGLTIITGGQSAVQEFLPIVQEAGNGNYIATSAPVFYPSVMASMKNPSATLTRFINDFTNNYNLMADAFGGQGYDTAKAVLNAVKKYNTTDSTILKDHVGELVGLEEPVSGAFLNYKSNKQMVKPLYVYKIVDGQFVEYDPPYISLTPEEENLATLLSGY
jgi:branched-chain amino acid transport system substrate-binding protein